MIFKDYIIRSMYPINPYIHGGGNSNFPSILTDGHTKAWFDSNFGVQSVGGLVSLWADKSGNYNHLLQSDSTKQPTITADGVVFIPSPIKFMKTGYFSLSQPISIYLAYKYVDTSSYIIDGYTADSCIYLSQTIYAGSFLSLSQIKNSDAWSFIYNSANSSIRNSGGFASGNVGTNAMNGVTLGARATGNYGCNIIVKELIVRAKADSLTDELNIRQYLSQKYNL